MPVVCRKSFIPADVWEGNAELEEVELGDYITSVTSGAFQDCTSLTTITFHESLHRIDANVFTSCTALQKIVLPPTLKEVDCWFDDRGVAKTTLSSPSSETIINYLKQGYPMDLYYQNEFRDDRRG